MNEPLNIIHLESLPGDAEVVNDALVKSKILFRRLIVDSKDRFISALTEFSPDLILADHSLPSFSTFEALNILKQASLDIPLIIITAAISEETALDLISEGADDYLIKDRLNRLPLAIFNSLEKFRLKKEHKKIVDLHIKCEKRYRALLEHSTDGVVIFDVNGTPTYSSASVTNVLGYDASEVLGMDIFALVHPQDISDLALKSEKILSLPGQTTQGHTARMLHKDGSWRWVEATITNLLDDPDIHGIIDNFRDVTERKIAQDAVIQNEQKFRSLVENSKDGMVILAACGVTSYISPSITNVLGYKADDEMLSNLFGLAHPEDSAKLLAVMRQAATTPGTTVQGDAIRMKHKNGEWRWIENSVTNMFGNQAINGFVDNFRDVTHKKLNDLVLAKSEEKYRLLFETSMDGILLISKNGQILEANQAACKIFQMTEDEIIATGKSGLVDITDPRLNILLEERSQTGNADGQIFFMRKDRSRFAAEISSTVFHDAYGDEKTSIFIRDISQRKLTEQLLIDSEEFSKGVLASLSSHICVIDNSGTIIEANRAWDEFGKTNGAGTLARTSIGSNYFEVCEKAILEGDNDAKQALDGILSVFSKENDVFEMEYRCDSLIEQQWFILQVKKFGQDDSRVVLSHQNITELKNAGRKLELSEYRLKQAQSMAKIGSWEINLQNLELIWSEQTYTIFGKSDLNFTPTYQAFLRLIHPDDRRAVDRVLIGSVEPGGQQSIEHRVIGADGMDKVIEERWSVSKDIHGSPYLLFGTCQDITRQKKAAEMIVRSEANLNAIIENTDSFIYSLDRDLNYVTFNSPLRKNLKENYNVELTAGYNTYEFIKKFDPEATEEWRDRYKKALNGEIVKFEKEFLTNGLNTCTCFSFYPIWENKNVIGLSCFVDDITKQKQAEEEYHFKAELLNTIGQAVIATDLNGKINYWNKAAENLYEFDAEEALGRSIADVTPLMATQQQDRQIVNALKKGEDWTGEFNICKKDGAQCSVLLNNSPIYDQHDQLTGIIGVSTDITQNKALALLLEKATTLARIGSYEADLVNNHVFWSPMTKLIHEVESDFIPDATTALDFYKAGPSHEIIATALEQVAEKQTPFDLELQIVTAKSNLRWVRVIGAAERVNGKVILSGSIQDIDKMKKIELALLEAYEEKNVILESIGDAFFAVDKHWVVNYWNKEAARLLNQPKNGILNKNLWEIFAGSVGSESYRHYKLAVETNQIVHFEDYYLPLETWLEVSAYPSMNGLSVFFKDITERRLSETKLVELNKNLQEYSNELELSNKGLEQFSYMVSHNLRAPVANIMGLGNLLGDDSYPADLKDEFLKGILANVQRLDDVIVDLNLILQVKQQIIETNESVDLQALVEDIESSIQGLIVRDKVRIIKDFRAVSEFETKKTYLHSILYNLIINGIKYHRLGVAPIIEIQSMAKDGKLIISVKDNGIGIDLEKNKGEIFGIYKRFHNHVEGKGMGLFIVKTQVEILGGKISVVSEVNKGTTFWIEFNYKTNDNLSI